MELHADEVAELEDAHELELKVLNDSLDELNSIVESATKAQTSKAVKTSSKAKKRGKAARSKANEKWKDK
eukprot:5022912-Pleurochrysis_carterae.AAC.1